MTPIANPLALGPELTIAHAATWHEALAGALAQRGGDLALDLGGVTDFDSSGVQLLLATRRSLVERGDALELQRASAAVRDALNRFGLAEMLPAATA
ncbi:MAG: STAS domain-containing protein [Burkholderiales bacterium]|nr:STAS domain-containing protein [Burkholderiales bacterium]MDE1929755.1 STAS domain-containing protein [Burkholderiales bacterium]MDE2505054.1 STAS domain-containing protein [Burkholderiales bacterium]